MLNYTVQNTYVSTVLIEVCIIFALLFMHIYVAKMSLTTFPATIL